MAKITALELSSILHAHCKWLRGKAGGVRANLAGANLTDANLISVNLTDANLAGVNLAGANLAGANLTGANLTDANLISVNLTDANLAGVNLTDGVPVIPNIDAAILASINAGGRLRMSAWHSCETTHCRAGWAITLAGPAGKLLDDKYGSSAAGALIYAASRPGQLVPNFFASDADAMADIVACAAKQVG